MRENIQITIIRNERRGSTNKLREIKRTEREYCEQLYVKNLDNLDETDKFLKMTETDSGRNRKILLHLKRIKSFKKSSKKQKRRRKHLHTHSMKPVLS